MALISRYQTPAGLTDLPASPTFPLNWHNYLAGRLPASVGGSNGGEIYDASEINVNNAGERVLTWMAFPRRILLPGNRDTHLAAFAAAEDRLVQDEYCEWHTTRNASGKITKVTFTTETPEYWEQMWAESRATVVNLYRSLVSPAVVEADLHNGSGTYVRRNRWNHADGIVHLMQNINTLDAALGLVTSSANSSPARDNYEIDGITNTSVDPRVAIDIGSLVRKPLSVTLRDPIGLYMTAWDDSGWSKPNGAPVGNYWRIVWGVPGMVLRLEYKVPASEGFVVGDIRIGGRPIEYGGQIAEHVTVSIAGVAGTRA